MAEKLAERATSSPISAQQLKDMPAAELAATWERVQAARSAAQDRCDLVHAELERRYRRKAERELAKAGKEQGTVHVIDSDRDVAVTFPGKDEIDQAAMAKAVAKVEALDPNWRAFVKVEYAISRTALKALPDKVRRLLEKPITVKVGKLRFAIAEPKATLKKAA